MKRRGEDFGVVAIGVPYAEGRGHYDFFRSFCWLLIQGGEPGDYFLNTEAVEGDFPLPYMHNALVREFLDTTEADTLVIVEDDHVFDPEVLRRMRTKEENWAFDIVCATYVSRRGWPPRAVSWHTIDPQTHDGYTVQFRPLEVETSGTQEYDGSGLGFVLIRRWVLEAMVKGRPLEDVLWFYFDGFSSPDVAFYNNAQALGARVGVDRDNRLGHIGKRVWVFGDFVRARDAAQKTGGKDG